MSAGIEVSPEQLAALTSRPADTPVLMVNLVKFKADGGQQRYRRYLREAAPHLQRVGGAIRYFGTEPAVILGDGTTPWWDAILIVEYPSPAAFVEMVADAEYAKVHQHRDAALDRGDLVATAEWRLSG